MDQIRQFLHDSGFEESSGFLEFIGKYPSDLLDTLNVQEVFNCFLRTKVETGHETDDVGTICRSIGMRESLVGHVLEIAQSPAVYHGDLLELIITVSRHARAVASGNVHGEELSD